MILRVLLDSVGTAIRADISVSLTEISDLTVYDIAGFRNFCQLISERFL